MGALSVTTNPKYQKPFTPLIPGVKVGHLNDTVDLEGLIGEKTCAVIVEPIQGEGGIHAADASWLRVLRKRCDEVGAVLIYDEIQVSQWIQSTPLHSLFDHSRGGVSVAQVAETASLLLLVRTSGIVG